MDIIEESKNDNIITNLMQAPTRDLHPQVLAS